MAGKLEDLSVLRDLRSIALTQMGAGELARYADKAAMRQDREAALAIDYYADPDRAKALADARFTVARFEWRKDSWRRVRRLCGPMRFESAVELLAAKSQRLGTPMITDI